VVVSALGVVSQRFRLHRIDSPDRGAVGVMEPAPTSRRAGTDVSAPMLGTGVHTVIVPDPERILR
jgi:hypothetical protein